MLSSVACLAVALLATSSFSPVSAQIDPSTVPQSTRDLWCNAQKSSCPLLCSQLPGESLTTIQNSCDAPTLTYSCVCENGQVPNAANYSQTIPYFLCTESNNQCVKNCPASDNSCQAACRQTRPCGAQNPTRINTTSSSTQSATGTSEGNGATKTSGGTVFTGLGGSSASTGSAQAGTPKSAGALALDLGQSFGAGILASGLLAAFALVL